MNIKFDENMPIFMQIIDYFKQEVAAGNLAPGDRIPSIRELSKILQVNPNTVGRAYQEMEREGITVTQRGLGVYISQDTLYLSKLKERLAGEYIATFTQGMFSLGFKKEEILNLLTQQLTFKQEDV